MSTRKILLLILSAGIVEPRPQRFQRVLLEEPFPPAPVPFNFNYEVNDAETGDTKSHQETLEDGVLKGTYTVVQPDGLLRVINYISDAENGFRADVKFEEGYDNVIPKAADKSPVQVVLPIQEEVDPPALVPYNFGYEVNDAETGDTKTHQEVLEDGVLRGSYSVVQPDGVRRVVNYVSDAENGFRADVTYEQGYGDVIPNNIEQQTSDKSTIQEVALTNNVAATSSKVESSLDTINSIAHNSLKDLYTNSQVFCADCNSESFGSGNVISQNSIDSSPSVELEIIDTVSTRPLVQVSDETNFGTKLLETSIDFSNSLTSIDFSNSLTSIDFSNSKTSGSSIKNVVLTNEDEASPAPQPMPFKFGYEVSDAETGDTKTHQETMEDGVLRGSYSLVQPDGVRRVVNYVSDAENGFRADVTFEDGYDNVIPKIIEDMNRINKL